MLLVVSDASGKEIATGTGFLVSPDGKLITNHHVIENASSVIAKSETGGLFPVKGLLADDAKNDLALLKVEGKDLPFLKFGNTDKVEVGTRIAVIGSPLGLEGTLSEGIVSAVRDLEIGIKLMQVTAAISLGSSGSPVMNANGEVVAVASALLHEGQALNFAVPAEFAKGLLTKLKTTTEPTAFGAKVSNSEDETVTDPYFRAAVSAEDARDYVQLLKSAKEVLRRHPDSALANYCVGVAYAYLNFWDEAIIANRQAIKFKPDYSSAWHNLGFAYLKSGRTDEAITAYRQAIKIDPDYPITWFNLGFAYLKSGRTDEAITAYRQAIKIDPNFGTAWYNLGNAYRKSGPTDEAIAAYRQAIKINPDYADAWYNLGNAYRDSSRTDEAITAYRQAIKINPDFANAWYNLGIAYDKSGRAEESAAAFQRAGELGAK